MKDHHCSCTRNPSPTCHTPANQSHLCFQWKNSNSVETHTSQVLAAILSNNFCCFLECLRSGDLQHSIGPSLFHIGLYQDFFYSTFTVRRVLVLKTENVILVNAGEHCDLALFLQCGCSISKGCRSERNPILHLIIFEVNRMRGLLERMCRY